MIRVVLFLVLVGIAAFGAAWLADNPGDVAITWPWLGRQGRIETSLTVAVMALTALVWLAVLSWSIIRALLRSPDVLGSYLRGRRGVRGYLAVSQGLIAVGSGDVRTARKFADEAQRIAPEEPLTLLLSAQSSQLAGDRAQAERTFHMLAERDDTRLLGLHGLFVEAQRREDLPAARMYAEAAAKNVPAPTWAGLAVLEFRCAAGDWAGALERLDRNMKSGLVDRATYRRQRAVLLTARAMAEDQLRNSVRALALALDAVKLAPTLVPAAALAGRLLGEAGDRRRAARVIEAAWKSNPHPDLADTFAHLLPGDAARDRLTRVQGLAAKAPGHVEGALAVARAAIDAHEFNIAREALAPLLAAPTRRVAVLMAELEDREHGDEGRAREWMTRAVSARRDPAWTADGFVTDRWMPVSPVTGRLDAFQWKDPLAGLSADANLIETERAARSLIDAPDMGAPRADGGGPATDVSGIALATNAAASRGRKRSPAPVAVAPAVIPLVHVPDDPGPGGELAHDPEIEPPDGSNDSWRKLRGLFK